MFIRLERIILQTVHLQVRKIDATDHSYLSSTLPTPVKPSPNTFGTPTMKSADRVEEPIVEVKKFKKQNSDTDGSSLFNHTHN